MSDEQRLKIQNSNILNVLVEHAEGKRELAASQVTAGIALLKKVLPDLQGIELSGKAGGPIEIVSKRQRDAAVTAALVSDS